MDTYEVQFKENETEGVYAISVVDSPAMESQFIALKKQEKVQLKAIDEEKMLLLGAVLIPNKLILRKQDGKEFNIVFPTKTVRLAMENFLIKGYQKNSTLEHDESLKLENVAFVEHWIKEDNVHDKSIKYGIDEEIGTWFTVMKAQDKETYEKIKAKGGFSIDGFFDLEKINLKSELNMSEVKNESLVDSFKAALSEFFSPKNKGENKDLQLGKVMTKDGKLTIEFDGDTIAVGTEMYLVNDTGEKLPVPDGEYTLEDDMIAVMEGSKVKELKPATEVAENKDPVAMDQKPTSEPAGTTVKSEKFTQEVFYQLAQEIGAQLEKFKTEFRAELKTELITELKTELSAEKAISLTKPKGEKKIDWDSLTPLEKFRLSKNNI